MNPYLKVIKGHHSELSVVYSDSDGLITTVITQDQANRLKELVHSGNYTAAQIRSIIEPLEQKATDHFVNNDYFIRSGRSLYLREIPQISIPYDLAEEMYPVPPENLLNFWRLAALNPDPIARDGLFWFLKTHDFEITPEGYFVAYRNAVKLNNNTWTDQHSRTTRIHLGSPVVMQRDRCDSNPDQSCSYGLHVASKTWLGENYFGDTGMICLVNPMHVVAVPPVDDYGKMRVCEYLPIGIVQYSNGKIASEVSFANYTYDLDELTAHQIKELIRTSNLSDGETKGVFTCMQDYHDVLEVARKSVASRLITEEEYYDDDCDDDYDEGRDFEMYY